MAKVLKSPTTCPLLLQNKSLIDALGYIDTEWNDAEARIKAQRQIEKEMNTFTPNLNEYIAFLPDYTPTFQNRARLLKEWKRVQAQVALNAIDMNRYNQHSIYEPSRKNVGSARAWKQANDQMKILIEHRHNEVLNLELEQKYVSNVWKCKVAVLEQLQKEYTNEHTNRKAALDQLNQERKQFQLLNSKKLTSYRRKYEQLLQKNHEIEMACKAYEMGGAKRLKTIA
ncbi:unnamed protein product [Albugo candida]|uniref:Pre-mRNA-splicing factor SPF27 n=1 Tax=Albugo candida TaxID=65357 RepID=A0A024FZ71_9STRA|nr:unnamed protein product [Albugo candida]|eukprot:CCI39608.1 unnamed protein product [Albugo candida]